MRNGRTGYVTAGMRARQWSLVRNRSIVAAVLVHAAVLGLWPTLPVEVRRAAPLVRLPMSTLPAVPGASPSRPPGTFARPEIPTVEDLRVDVASLFADHPLPTFDERLVVDVPPPPLSTEVDEWSTYASFSPRMMQPEIRNRSEVVAFLERHYQPLLDRTGARGLVQVDFWIDEEGTPRRSILGTSSGNPALDDLCLDLARLIRFTPARRDGDAVRVLVRVPIRFEERILRR